MIILKNKNLQVVVKSFGAELSSIKKVDSEYEYLWQGHKEYWKRQAPILFPIVGRLLNDTYKYNEESYHMTQHGFARDSEFEVVESSDRHVVYGLKSNEDSLLKYPFEFELQLGYELVNDLIKVSYKVINLNDQVMPFSIGAHPAFNWDKSQEARFDFNEVEVKSYLVTSKGITDGPKVSLKPIEITEDLFRNDALVYEGLYSTVFNNGSIGIEMNFEGFPYVGLWSMPSGAPFVCIEPWYGFGDKFDHNGNLLDKEGIVLLESKDTFKASYTIKPL